MDIRSADAAGWPRRRPHRLDASGYRNAGASTGEARMSAPSKCKPRFGRRIHPDPSKVL
jgi:hypothetical protein